MITEKSKKTFFILILLTLILTVSSVNAAEDANSSTVTTDNSLPDEVITSQEHVNIDDNIINTEHKLEKTDKNKKESIEVNGITYDTVVENQRITGKTVIYDTKTFINNCTSKSATRIYLSYDSAINNSVIASTLDIGGYNYYVYNSTLNCEIIFDIGFTNFYIDENTVIGENFSVSNTSRLITNNTQVLEYIQKENEIKYITVDDVEYMLVQNKNFYNDYEVYNSTFFNNCSFNWYTMDLMVNEPTIINNSHVNFGIYNERKNQLIIYNSTLNGDLDNSGLLIIDENTNIGEKFYYNQIGNLQTNNSAIKEYLKNKGVYIGTNTIENQTITGILDNYGNLTIRNCTIITNTYQIENYGNLSIENSTINRRIKNSGNLSINDDVIFEENCIFSGPGNYTINDIYKIIPYLREYYGEYNLNNVTINKGIYNVAKLTFTNSTLNSSISNYGTLIISDDTILSENFFVYGDGDIIINDTSRLFDYQEVVKYDTILEDMNITFNKTFTANTSLINCEIHGLITNQGNMTFINCSFSNNNMTVDSVRSGDYAFLLNNQGTCRLENCIIENNTFNSTKLQSIYEYILLHGAILNNGTMTVIDTVACNNSLGYVKYSEERYRGDCYGQGTVLSNFANLNVINTTFINNYAGISGAAIFNTADLTVNNSVFEDNRVTLRGAAITTTTTREEFIVKNVKIFNTEFKNNIVNLTVWENPICGGAIFSEQSQVNIKNCTFDANKAYTTIEGIIGVNVESASIVFEGNRGNMNMNNTAIIDNCTFINHDFRIITNGKNNHGVNGIITHCIFENNHGGIKDQGNLNITNNTFKNTTNTDGIIYDYILSNGQQKTVSNNQFIDNNLTTDTIYNSTYGTYQQNYPIERIIENNTYINTTINDTINLTVPIKIEMGEPITITGTYKINNPENYDPNIIEKTKFNIYINGKLEQTIDTLEFTVTPNDGNMIITVQPTISQTRKTTIIRTTAISNITITPENYEEYIIERELVGIETDTTITFQGEFTDKDEIYINTNNLILEGSTATFTNTVFILDAVNIAIKNMNINNNDVNYPISNYGNNNLILNNTITLNNPHSNATAIYNSANNTMIANNTLTVTALPGSIDFTVRGVADTQAILLLGGDKNIVQNNTINIKSTQATGYNTLEGITNSNGATNTLITQNKINISDANFNYAIDCLSNVENITITENTMLVTGERYCDGIQVGNNANNIIIDNNNITCICINSTPITQEGAITYGVIATSMGSAESNNITITNNNINITGTANYAIELYKVNKTEIHSNNITVNGPYSLGIGYSYAPNGNATGNTITINGDSTTPINAITEEIKPENTGIRVQNGTQNVNIENNTIKTSDIGIKDTTIHTDESTVTIKNNKLTSTQGYGIETVQTLKPGVTFENNTIETTITTENITTQTNTPTTLTATVTTIDKDNINGGTVIFTDTNGNTIAEATVTDGKATTTATFTQTGENTLTATYYPTSMGLTRSNSKFVITIDEETLSPALIINPITASVGETINITARITLKTETLTDINMGKITFKVNGKTLKDASGKVIYAKVVNGTAVIENYIVPADWAKNDTTIQAVYSGSKQCEKLTSEKTQITITPTTPTITTTDITATAGETITLTATITDNNKVINNGKIVFKINGKTVKDANGKVIYAKVTNGTVSVDYTLPESYKAGNYTVTATFIASGYDKLEAETTLNVVN